MPSIYDFATGPDAELGPPPDAWVLRGQSSNLPFIAGYDNWLARGILDDLEPLVDHYDPLDSESWLADTIYPMTGYVNGDITGIYLNRSTSSGVVGIRLHARGNDLQLFVEESGGTDRHNWLFKDDGTLQIANTLGVYGFLAGLDSTSKLRYGYASTYPTFRMDFDPFRGGWTVKTPEMSAVTWDSDEAILSSSDASVFDAYARYPLNLPHDLDRTTETVYELMELTGILRCTGGAALCQVAVMRAAVADLSSPTAVMTISTATSGTVTSTSGAPIVLDPSQYVYYLEWTGEDIGAGGTQVVAINRLYLKIRKRAVE